MTIQSEQSFLLKQELSKKKIRSRNVKNKKW